MADLIFVFPMLFPLLHIFAALSFLVTLALVVKLYLETDKGWYWLSLVLSIALLALSEWITLVFPLERRGALPILASISEAGTIAGAILLAVSFYGMYKTMHDIRKRVE